MCASHPAGFASHGISLRASFFFPESRPVSSLLTNKNNTCLPCTKIVPQHLTALVPESGEILPTLVYNPSYPWSTVPQDLSRLGPTFFSPVPTTQLYVCFPVNGNFMVSYSCLTTTWKSENSVWHSRLTRLKKTFSFSEEKKQTQHTILLIKYCLWVKCDFCLIPIQLFVFPETNWLKLYSTNSTH